MTADDQRTPATRVAQPPHASRSRLRTLARTALWRLAPAYARRRASRADAIARLARVEAAVEHVGERHDEQIERLEDLARELILTTESLRRGVGDVDSVTASTRRELGLVQAELNALPYIADSPFQVMQAPVGVVLGYSSAASLRGGGSDYVDFEELFRGPTARVAESQRPYLTLARDHGPVLDLGCGRGEFLAMLAGEGISARGVDSDAGMIERCRALGLAATLADANEHLQGLQDGSLGTIFSAQLIEHLPHAQLTRMLSLSVCKLGPGGLLIAETVNPHRVSSLKTFWVDLTHQHPIFPEVALALCAIAGFESAYVFAPGFDSFEHARLHAPAYAVVATAPPASREQA
jgi:2-polyprenyl-3-methyl-5-hydroxy-6-metoxy-1,4-benzoquinol methylase